MHDNQIEVLSKAIDGLVAIRAVLSRTIPVIMSEAEIRAHLANVTNARYLVACLATGEEWNP